MAVCWCRVEKEESSGILGELFGIKKKGITREAYSCFLQWIVVFNLNIRRKQTTWSVPWHGVQQVLFCRSWKPCGCGTRVCSFSFCLRVGMYVSYEILFMCCILNLRAAKIGKKYEQSNYKRIKKSFELILKL